MRPFLILAIFGFPLNTPLPTRHARSPLAVAQLLVVFGYTCMYFALSSVLRKTGGSIAACIVCPMIVSLLFTTISSIVNIESFDLSDYWLDGLFGSLSQAAVSGKTALTSIVLSLVCGAVFTSVGVIVSNRQTV